MRARCARAALLLLCACQGEEAADDRALDVQHMALSLDLERRTATATLDVLPALTAGEEGGKINLDIGDLEITGLSLNGEALPDRPQARLRLQTGAEAQQIRVDYRFQPKDHFVGWMPDRGLTFIWPYFCGNLFPCHPAVSDGLTFSLALSGVPAGQTALYGERIDTEAPPYMVGLAVGDYTGDVLGVTQNGTEISAWSLPGDRERMLVGTANLAAAFDYLEQTYGPYAFGDRAGTVGVDWDYIGGMEHHPFWHSSRDYLGNPEIHTHEAAHGWFGDGVRIACWEDLVLSEGTTTYISARAVSASGGPDLFDGYATELHIVCNNDRTNVAAMPGTCGEIDILHDPLWSMIPYMKGACFYEEVAELIGAEPLDRIISAFYLEHLGEAATMQQMLDHIAASVTPAEAARIDGLATEWLKTAACPTDGVQRCRVRGNLPP